MRVEPRRLHLVQVELQLRLRAFPAALAAQFAAGALVVGQHEPQRRDRDVLAVPGRLQVRDERGERQSAGRPGRGREVAQVDVERGRPRRGDAQAALQPRGGGALRKRAQVQLRGLEQHLADRQRGERGDARAGGGLRRRAVAARLALQVGRQVEARERPVRRRLGGPVRQGGRRRRRCGRGRGAGCVVRGERDVERERRVRLRHEVALGLHAFPAEPQALHAVQPAALRANGQRGPHVAQRRVVGDGQRGDAQARDVDRDGTAQRARRGRRLGRRRRRQRRDAHGVGERRRHRHAHPGAGVRMPVQVEAAEAQVRHVDLHVALDSAQGADAQLAAAQRAVDVDHGQPGHVRQQPARADLAEPQRADRRRARARQHGERRRGIRRGAAGAAPGGAPGRRGGRGRRGRVGLGHRVLRTPRRC